MKVLGVYRSLQLSPVSEAPGLQDIKLKLPGLGLGVFGMSKLGAWVFRGLEVGGFRGLGV